MIRPESGPTSEVSRPGRLSRVARSSPGRTPSSAIAGDPAGGAEPLVQALSEGERLSRREQIVVLWESGKREEAERRALDAAAAGEPVALRDLDQPAHRRAADRERKEEARHAWPRTTEITSRCGQSPTAMNAAAMAGGATIPAGLERGDQQPGCHEELARLGRALRGIDSDDPDACGFKSTLTRPAHDLPAGLRSSVGGPVGLSIRRLGGVFGFPHPPARNSVQASPLPRRRSARTHGLTPRPQTGPDHRYRNRRRTEATFSRGAESVREASQVEVSAQRLSGVGFDFSAALASGIRVGSHVGLSNAVNLGRNLAVGLDGCRNGADWAHGRLRRRRLPDGLQHLGQWPGGVRQRRGHILDGMTHPLLEWRGTHRVYRVLGHGRLGLGAGDDGLRQGGV